MSARNRSSSLSSSRSSTPELAAPHAASTELQPPTPQQQPLEPLQAPPPLTLPPPPAAAAMQPVGSDGGSVNLYHGTSKRTARALEDPAYTLQPRRNDPFKSEDMARSGEGLYLSASRRTATHFAGVGNADGGAVVGVTGLDLTGLTVARHLETEDGAKHQLTTPRGTKYSMRAQHGVGNPHTNAAAKRRLLEHADTKRRGVDPGLAPLTLDVTEATTQGFGTREVVLHSDAALTRFNTATKTSKI